MSIVSLRPYASSNGWLAYPMLDGGGVQQIRTRAPDGTVRQVTSLPFNNFVRALGPDGTVVYTYGGTLYAIRAPYTSGPTRLGRDWFTVRFRGTELLLLVGNTAFSATYRSPFGAFGPPRIPRSPAFREAGDRVRETGVAPVAALCGSLYGPSREG